MTEFKRYPEVPSNPDYAKLEEEILAFWEREGIFQASVDQRRPDNEFVFYDGPPFANGLPHYGHLVTGYVKDIVPRYQTMRGKRVERRFGWDCHGLPAELPTEKELNLSGRVDILEFGIKKFNDQCRRSVLKFTQDWEYYVKRQGRWCDFENDYKTLDITYMESVMWAFKQLWDKGLVYEDYRVVPYSWAVESPLSNFETRMDNAYRTRQDPAITVAFKLSEDFEGKTAYILAWTTTPWTLPSNLALAVGPDIDYAVLEKDGEHIILADALLEKYEKEFGGANKVKVVKGGDLTGLSYEPLFPFFKDTENAFQVLHADFVDIGEGTGVVHMAPGFGEDDFKICRENDIPVVVPVDNQGRFTPDVSDYEGQLVFDANKPIIKNLKDRGILIRHDTIDHNYPHCWRTDEPLIYKAIHSWYIEVSKFKDRMVELNQGINWIPEHVRDGAMGKWLENARDWNIGRNRFWGSPIPVWKSDNPDFPRIDVYGSLEELERDFGVSVTSLHRPDVDELTRPNPDDPSGQSTMRRVEDVLDCWFESGSMPYAQVHYPFENQDWFDSHFPGDFIVEYIAQTRGWFYTLMVLSTALFDRAPFKNCICHGVVLDENNKKLSKRLKNYPDPIDVFNTHGSDAMRWFLVSTPLMHGGDISIPNDDKVFLQVRNQVMAPIWNAYSFYTLYANADKVNGRIIQKSTQILDNYILSKTRDLVTMVQEQMDSYDIPRACATIRSFLDALNNWYIRRSRDRFWKSAADQDKIDAYNTLYTVLTTLCRVAAPFLPFTVEYIYKNLTGEKSVHLSDWPKAEDLPVAPDLVHAMDRVRDVCSAALSIRETNNLRVRLPLAELIVAAENASVLEPYIPLIQDEINVKKVTLSTKLDQFGILELKINPQIGKHLKNEMKSVMAAAKAGEWSDHGDGTITIAGQILNEGDYSMRLVVDDGLAAQQLSGQGTVILDTKVTPELECEGVARDLIRLIQTTRKEVGLDITDRIRLTLSVPESAAAAIKAHENFIMEETLTKEITLGAANQDSLSMEHDLLGTPVTIAIEKLG